MSDEEEEENKELSEEQEEEENEEENKEENEEENKEENSNKNITNEIKEPKKPHSYYQSIINELEKELESQKELNNKLDNDKIQEQIEKLKNDLNFKNTTLEKLKATNNKQKSVLNEFTKRLEQEKMKSDKIVEKEDNDIESKKRIQKISFKSEEDKKLDKAAKTMKELRMKNEQLVKILYESKDYTNKMDLEVLNKEIKEQLEQKKEEKKLLIKQLQSHSKCKEEQKQLNEDIIKLMDELKKVKSNIQEIRDKNDNLILDYSKKVIPKFSFELNKKVNKISPIYNALTSKRLIMLNKSTPNIHTNQNGKYLINNKITLPLILTKKISIYEDTILTNEFMKKIQDQFKGNDSEYNTLIKKIKLVENNGRKTENKLRNEMNEKNLRLSSLDDRFKVMKIEKKHSDLSSQLLKIQLNNCIKGNKQKVKELKEQEKELQNIKNNIKTKNEQISKLLGQINYIRSLISLSNMKIEDNEIKKYIEKIKREKSLKLANKNNNKEEEMKNDINIITTKNINEESIQVDSTDDKNSNKKEVVKTKKKSKKNNKK